MPWRSSLLLFGLVCGWLLLASQPSGARAPASLGYQVVEGVFHSEKLNRNVAYWALLPQTNGPVPVVYFLHGRDGNARMFKDLGGVQAWQDQLKDGPPMALIALTGVVDGRNTYWVNEAQGLAWADMLVLEMMPWLENKYGVGGRGSQRMLAGISMGSHGAFQLALNYPGRFQCAAGHSLVVRDYASASTHFPRAFGTPAQFAARDPLSLLARYTQRQDVPIKKVWVDIGKQDDPHFIQQAKKMKSELQRLGYNPWRGDKLDVAVRSGGHDSGYWSQRLPEYIEWYNRCFHPVP